MTAADKIIEAEEKIDNLLDLLTIKRERAVYIQIGERPDGTLVFHQVEFLTPAEFAALYRVDERTVYSWKDKGLIKGYKPKGTGGLLFDLTESLTWIRTGNWPKGQVNGEPENN